MSKWTHITACLEVDTGVESKDIGGLMEILFQSAPRITGSEQDADIFINIPSGHSIWNSVDCMACKYNIIGEKFCNPPDGYKCPDGEYQTKIVITVFGNLRDRIKSITQQEYRNFIKWINSKGFIIEKQYCDIKED